MPLNNSSSVSVYLQIVEIDSVLKSSFFIHVRDPERLHEELVLKMFVEEQPSIFGFKDILRFTHCTFQSVDNVLNLRYSQNRKSFTQEDHSGTGEMLKMVPSCWLSLLRSSTKMVRVLSPKFSSMSIPNFHTSFPVRAVTVL